MKKLLGILVLGLLWCNVGIAAKYSKVKLGMGKVDYCNIFIWSMKNTCSLDHPNALLNYISRGMKVFKKEVIKI